MSGDYSYSLNEERYHGRFPTIDAACQEAAAEVGIGADFWVGENSAPPSPEGYWNAADWLEQVSCQDEYCGDWAEGWDGSTKAQQDDLERDVRAVLATWLDRHGLRPQFWTITGAAHYRVAGKEGDRYVVEPVTPLPIAFRTA